MNEIKFSFNFPKLWGQTSGRLLSVELLDAKNVQANKDLLEYDTKYIDKRDYTGFEGKEILEKVERFSYYPLQKSGKLIQLIFLGDKGIPFCTLRSYTVGRPYKFRFNRYDYYSSKIGQEFEIKIQGGEDHES